MKRIINRVILGLMLGFSLMGNAHAGLLAEAVAGFGGFGVLGYPGQSKTANQQYGRAETLDNIFYNGVESVSNATATARAWAEYGRLGVYGMSTATGWNDTYQQYRFYTSTNSFSSFTDSWTISNPSLNGQQGRIDFVTSLQGAITGQYSAIIITLFGGGNQLGQLTYDSLNSGTTSSSLGSLVFIFGQPFEVIMQLRSGTATNGLVDVYSAWISQVAVWNGSNQIAEYEITAGSGQNYGFGNQPAVPVPATMLLLGPGLIGLAWVRRKFKK